MVKITELRFKLTEAIEAFIKELYSDNDELFKSLKKNVLSDIYDTCFY